MFCKLPIDTHSTIATAAAANSHASFVMQSFACCSDIGQGNLTRESPQDPPGFDSSTVSQPAQTQGALSTTTTQLQHPNTPVEHYTSEEGISRFDDDDDAAQQGAIQLHDSQQSVGLENMSALQASLPVGVSMTIGSSQ